MKHMISAKELNRLGLPDDPRLMPLALKLSLIHISEPTRPY